jgi:hypothetical protein
MILFHDIVEILDLADGDGGTVLLVVALDGRFIGRTSIDGDLLWHAVAADCLEQEPLGGLLVALFCQQEINGLARLIDGTIEIIPVALHIDIRLIHALADPHRALAPVERLFQLRTIFHDPTLDSRVVDRHPTLFQQFFDMPIAQGIRQIPAHAHQNDILWEMGPLKLTAIVSPPLCSP